MALHDVLVGAVRLQGKTGLDGLQSNLDWIEPVALTVGGAAETGRIDRELHGRGEPIGPLDTLVAGIVRNESGTVVTRGDQFTRVENLTVGIVR